MCHSKRKSMSFNDRESFITDLIREKNSLEYELKKTNRDYELCNTNNFLLHDKVNQMTSKLKHLKHMIEMIQHEKDWIF